MRFLHVLLPAALTSLIVLTASDAPAGCTTGGLGTMPRPDGSLAVNGRIVLEGTGRMAGPVAALDSTGLVLASDTEEIPLRVETIHIGRWNAAQAILAPVREPAPGARLSLRASATGKGLPIDLEITRNPRFTWTTTASLPAGAVHWTEKPTRGKSDIGTFCPPHAYVALSAVLDHPEQVLGVLAEVRALAPGAKSHRYLVSVNQGEIAIGHLGCEMALELSPGG